MKIFSLKKGLAAIFLSLAMTLLFIAPASAMEKEDIFFREIPMVVTASRVEQPINEAPSAMYVITAEDIKQSGVTNIPDLLRIVPGLHIKQFTGSSYDVNVRGIVDNPANKTPLLIDGRSVKITIYDSIYWPLVPITLEEIERIEVIRGPASTLYGANAMTGLINIITKKARDTQGILFSSSAGEKNALRNALLQGGEINSNLKYRLSLENSKVNHWGEIPYNDKLDQDMKKIGVTLDYEIEQDASLTLFGYYQQGECTVATTSSLGIVDVEDADITQVDLRYQDPSIMARVNIVDSDQKKIYHYQDGGGKFNYSTDLNFELQHNVDLNNHSLIWGLNYMNVSLNTNYLSRKEEQDRWGVFIEEAYKIEDDLILTLGLRIDSHPEAG